MSVEKEISDKCVSDRIAHLMEMTQYYDITLILENKFNSQPNEEIHAYKCILSVGSPVFRKMLNCCWSKKSRVNIKLDFDNADSFKEVLRFMYSDTVNLTVQNTSEILHLATKYLIKLLVDKCVHYLQINVCVDNCLDIYKANSFDEDVKLFTINYIKDFAAKVIRTDSFLNIEKETLEMILKIDDLYVGEVDLYMQVHKWILSKCNHLNWPINTSNKQRMIGNLIYLIRFPIMTLIEFTDCITLDRMILSENDREELFEFFRVGSGTNLRFSTIPRINSTIDGNICMITEDYAPIKPMSLESKCKCSDLTVKFKVNQDIILTGLSFNNFDDRVNNFDIKHNSKFIQSIKTVALNQRIKLTENLLISKFRRHKISIASLNGVLYKGDCTGKFTTVDGVAFKIFQPGGFYQFIFKKAK